MHTLINGSQKIKNNNSSYFLKYLSKYLDEYNLFDLKKEDYSKILQSINESENVVLAFPLYVDSPTSITLKFLDYIYDNKINLNNKKIYVIINCGFREGYQNITGLQIVKNWCNKVNAMYSGSILIGAGEIVGNAKFRLITKKAHKKLHEFSVDVSNNSLSKTFITSMDFLNNKGYIMLANYSWTKQGKKNKLTKKDLNCT